MMGVRVNGVPLSSKYEVSPVDVSDGSGRQSLIDSKGRPYVITPLLSGEDTGNGWLSVSLKNRVSDSTDFVGTAAAPVLIDGPVTKRFKLGSVTASLGRYAISQLFIRASAAAGAPSVTVRLYLAADSSLAWDDSNGEAQVPSWQEYVWWKYVMNEPIEVASVSDATDPSADLVAAVAGEQIRVYGATLMAGGTAVSVGFQSADASENYHQQFPFAANGGLVWPLSQDPDRFWLQNNAGKGLQLDKSAAAAAVGHIVFRRHPWIVTAPAKRAVWVPRCEAIGIQFVGTGVAGTDKISFHVRHVGYH